MAKLVVLWRSDAAVRVGQDEAGRLARLGITSIGLLRDDRTVGVVLDGWAFDPARQAEAAIAALSSEPPTARLLPVAEIGMASASLQGGHHDATSPDPGRVAGGGRAAGARRGRSHRPSPHDRA